ncbi:hypothetical protein [Microcoleus sp. K5-D4]|uniref:hypothetical protein n=1 Tax=Microcoleus sp. K5-D4 TaxID=2818801 RepID=UPI002FD69320
MTATAQKLQSIYEKIELPPIRPIITRIERYGGQCACCQTKYVAPVPLGMEPGSPFGSSIQSLVTYLRYTHAISYERLSSIFGEVFGLKISGSPEFVVINKPHILTPRASQDREQLCLIPYSP